MSTTAFVSVREYVESLWPKDLLEPPALDAFDHIWIEPFDVDYNPDMTINTALLFETELAVGIPGVDAIKLVFAPSGSYTAFSFRFIKTPVPTFQIVDVPISLRIRSDILKPAKRVSSGRADQPDTFEPDPSAEFVDITLAKVTISLDLDGNIRLDGGVSISLPPCYVSSTGAVIEAEDIGLYLDASNPPPGMPAGWRGIHMAHAGLYLPGELAGIVGNLEMTDCYIGNGGFTGTVSDTWTPALSAQLFGMQFSLSKVDLAFIQNALTSSSLHGQITLPFFDAPVDVELGIAEGGFTVKLRNTTGGLYELSKPGVLSMSLDSLGFKLQDGVFTAMMSGRIKPEVGAPALDWPGFKVDELSIDSEGHVRLDGGWFDLRDNYALNLYGFKLEVSKLGFGQTDDGGKWVGFSGGLKLVDGMPAGASVEGLRVSWYEDGRAPRITLNGVGVEFEVPDVLKFKGEVAYRELTVDGQSIHRFDGDIKLNLISLGLEIDAALVVGSAPGYTFFAIHLGVELPAGIPLWSTGLALYGMAGLFANQMEPNKLPEEEWYEGWYKRGTPGVENLKDKWVNHQDSLALGAGVTIGTVADNGFTFAGKVLLAIVFPGPILLIEGKANLLKERAKLSDDPVFRALAVLDNRTGTFEVGLDAQYKSGSGGELIDIRGGAEAFFSFADASAWHLYIGEKEPREKRIRANLFKLFEANAYFMLDAHSLAIGAWVGYDEKWTFGPLNVVVEAWLEGNAKVSFKPAHFHGDVWLHGKIGLSAFGIGLTLTADANLSADVFDPFHILGQLHAAIELPWPLPDLSADVKLEWGPEPKEPPLPLPLQEVAVEHFKSTASWPLPRHGGTRLLLPDYDGNNDGFADPPNTDPASLEAAAPPANGIPVIPLDARPHLTFARAMNDDALAGVNPQPAGWERIGDPSAGQGPMKARYGLKAIELHKWTGGSWEMVAQTGAADDDHRLWGSWAPVPKLPSGEGGGQAAQTKLWLWSLTPFNYTRHTSGAWDEWFTGHFTDYPCIPPAPSEEVCFDFEKETPGMMMLSPWKTPSPGNFVIHWLAPEKQTVIVANKPADGLTHALRFPSRAPSGPLQSKPNEITIELGSPVDRVVLTVTDIEGVVATGFDAEGTVYGPFYGGKWESPQLEITGKQLVRISMKGYSSLYLFKICAGEGADREEVMRREEMAHHLSDELARWSQTGEVLQPHSVYRLKVVTTIEAEGEAELAGHSRSLEMKEFAYFKTEGPPGLTRLSVPIGQNPDSFDSGLGDLTRYVEQTVPATKAAAAGKPVLPRPVYRAYDVGVAFNENYVDLMYRLDGRDLGLYLFDNNHRPVRDALGRLIVLNNRWGNTEQLTLTESETRYITLINSGQCVSLDPSVIPHAKTLASAIQVLDPDTAYEARLVPLLWHESFGGFAVGSAAEGPSGTLGRWKVRDDGTSGGPSRWEVREDTATGSRWIEQLTDIMGGTMDRTNPFKPGTMLLLGNDPNLEPSHSDQPANWTDYRFSTYLRSADDDAFGVVFRYRDQAHHYRFSMDRERKYRRLVRIFGGVHTILAEDEYSFIQDQDEHVTVEAIGESLRVYIGGSMVFDVNDSAVDEGGIGLYCWGDAGALFSDIRVDDFREAAPVVYRFAFTTSNFTNFFHHLHSYQDAVWKKSLADSSGLAAWAAQASAPALPLSDGEQRAYEQLAERVLESAARQDAERVEVTRVTSGGTTFALLLRSPEPIDWKRTSLKVQCTDRLLPRPLRPSDVKLTDAVPGASLPGDEQVSLLLQKAADLSGRRIEYLHMPGPLAEPEDDVLLLEDFAGDSAGVLFREEFGPNALDHYTIVDEGNYHAPSIWQVKNGHLVQSRNIFGGTGGDKSPDKPGTLAVTGSAAWTDVRIRAVLRSGDDDAIGLVFRYRDSDNYYRFSMDRDRRYRRLVKRVGGTVKVLWEDKVPYDIGRTYNLVVDACGGQLLGWLDNALLFSVQDGEFPAGQVGFYCWANLDAHFEALTVESLSQSPLLWEPKLGPDLLNDFEVVDAIGATDGPSDWTAEDGTIVQDSNIYAFADGALQPGTYAVGGEQHWRDVQISVRLRSLDNDAIGVLFRYADPDHYYAFVMDKERSFRRLVKKSGGVTQVLWEDRIRYRRNHAYELTIRTVGTELQGSLDGKPLFKVYDGTFRQGRLGLYCRANIGARFERIVVTDCTRRVGQWVIQDEGTVNAPSVWKLGGGSLKQTSDIYGLPQPAAPGTCAVAGNPAWKDYRMTVTVRSDDGDALGVLFRYRDSDNYYRFSIDKQHGYRRLVRKQNGTLTTLWETAGGYPPGQSFKLTIDAVGTRLAGYLDDTRMFMLDDGALGSGQIGLYCSDNAGVRFERVEVVSPPLEAMALFRDQFANHDTAGWTFKELGTVSGTSSWFAGGVLQQTGTVTGTAASPALAGALALAGDPAWSDVLVRATLQSMSGGAIGVVLRYTDSGGYYGFSMDNKNGFRRFVKNRGGTSTVLWEDAASYDTGRAYELTVSAIGATLRASIDGIPIFSVEDADLAAGQVGLYCSNNTDARFSQVGVYPEAAAYSDWLLNDSFAALVPGRWSIITGGDTDGPAQWSCTGDDLQQTSGVYKSGVDPAGNGTYAIAGSAGWTDYRMCTALRSEADGAIGVIFRYKDEDNYFCFYMDRKNGLRRLIKKQDGAVTGLWSSVGSYDIGRLYLLTIDCEGPLLTGYLDGIQLFRLEAEGLASGQIGLFCSHNPGARFSEVRIAGPVWSSYYTFGREERMEAGTKVRISSGSISGSPETGIVYRSSVSIGEQGKVRFPTNGVNLRIVSPGAASGHMRRFLPASEYADANVKVLRKADGTALFILMPDAGAAEGSAIPFGQYRLKLTYRRNNKAADPNSQILKEGGNDSPEQVTLDIPWE